MQHATESEALIQQARNIEPEVLWKPSPAQIEASRLAAYQRWLARERGKSFDSYAALWQWSVDDLEGFWQSIWDFFDVQADGARTPVLVSRQMPGAQWYPNVRLNYAEHVFRGASDQRPALIVKSESGPAQQVSWAQLKRDTAALAATLRSQGIRAGDRVASYLPSRSQTVIGFLACASIGAVWSSCAPDMGVTVVLDRFRQIEPKLLLATDSYQYNGKVHSRVDAVAQLLSELPSVQQVIQVPGPASVPGKPAWPQAMLWDDSVTQSAPLAFERLPFNHPLWIVYSSGTTGLPKAIVHGHGGIVLTQYKTMALQHDIRANDRMLFLGSTGWIVWNLHLASLMNHATMVVYDGSPTWPDAQSLWRFVGEQEVTLFGCGAAYLINCLKEGLRPCDLADFACLRSINSTGSPLPVDAYRWVYAAIKQDLWLASISGGTDIASGFVACAPVLPVVAGEIQCRELAVAAFAYNEAGKPVVNEVGELVVTQPMPSMPLYFWNDPQGHRYRESYFELFPGIWRHGDWIRFTERGTSVIYGRSDSTINRFGIRMGTAEIYRVVEAIAQVRDSLVIDLEYLGRASYMPLFVVLQPGESLTDNLKQQIVDAIKRHASARHVPNEIFQIEEVPRTLTGKKMEVPVRKLLLGFERDKVASADAMANPHSLEFFVRLAKTFQPSASG